MKPFLFMSPSFALLFALAFVLGSVPVGQIIARIKGIDLRKVGSGNIGATNVLRAMGKAPAILTLLGDVIKGVAAVAAGKYVFPGEPAMVGIIGLAVIAGHIFSIFLGFKGGKGVATGFGVILVYSPKVALITLVIWLAVAFITRYSSLGAIAAVLLLPVNLYIFDFTREKLIISVMITLLLMIRHLDNIGRLIKGTESRIGGKT